MQIVELRCPQGNLGRQGNLAQPQRQKVEAPPANVCRPLQAASPERPAQLEEYDSRNGEFTRVESGVAPSSCRPSQPWRLLGQPKDRVRIEQEGHRIVQ